MNITITVTPELLRLRAKMSIEQLAKATGLSIQHIGRIERGEVSRLQPDTLATICKALGTDEYIDAAFAVRKGAR